MNFSLDTNFGNLLGNIAQEHLVYDLDPEKAIETFTESLVGISEEMALELLSGKNYVLVSSGSCEIEVRERKEGDTYPTLDFCQIIENLIRRISKEAREFGESVTSRLLPPSGYYTIDLPFSFEELVSLFEEGKLEDKKTKEIKEEILMSDPDIEDKIRERLNLTKTILSWKSTVDKRLDVISWIVDKGLSPMPKRKEVSEFSSPDEWLRYSGDYVEYQDMIQEVNLVMDLLNSFSDNQHQDEVDKYRKALEEKVTPIDVSEKRDALWISPGGLVYGLNGEIANMLHIKIADELLESGVVSLPSESHDSIDSYLEKEGWVKVHGDWIMFEPHPGASEIPIFITEEQSTVISRYLKNHYNGIGKFGIKHNTITSSRWESMDGIMKNKLFSY